MTYEHTVELQKDMCEAASKITAMTELRDGDHVGFLQGDFLQVRNSSGETKYLFIIFLRRRIVAAK
jgi:hypothetical protein